MRLVVVVSVMAALPMAVSFVTPSARSHVAVKTPTTLFYRDDVPPIGSSPHWETPNDFNQFLTQCSIQSFMFLLNSLSDVHTMQWLQDFTDPVLMETPKGKKIDKNAKVSLAEAAQAALADIEMELGSVAGPFPSLALVEETVVVNEEPKVVEQVEDTKKKVFQPSIACLKMLEDKGAVKKAFSHYTVGMYLAKKKKQKKNQEELPVSNTGISQLYSSLPTAASFNNNAKKGNFAPFAGKKFQPSSTPKSNWAPFQGGLKQSMTSSTSSLYGHPPPSDTKKKTASRTPKSKESAKVSSKDDEEEPPTEWKTFPKTNPVALKYHGLAILNRTRFPTWDSYFEQLLGQPKESYLVESWHAQIPAYEMDIDPASLVRRMLSVRMQIANEFEHDLQVIADMCGLTLKSYHKMLREIREQRAEEELQQQKDKLEKQIQKSMEENISENNGAASTDTVDDHATDPPSIQRANLLFLDSSVGAEADYAPSPLRKSNFDLLCLLATQEAIHRVLNDPSRQARKAPEHGSNQFLQDFYVKRLLSHFTGDQPYGRSDDFLEELLESPPRMITVGDHRGNGEEETDQDSFTKDLTYLVDPVKVAEIILNEREKVALEWKQQLAEQTKEDHMALQKMVLARVMGQSIEECEIVDSEGNDVEEDDDVFGSCFE
ncbi:expressed unknown protein [Seminavis robusta]|uniref:Uncharacterized protein n=1 Tax=Seminavis robusta TaxID=568900 RepID=A0A9N8DZD0_9STRA|nr:expressed unknown protein [Seminavis robusta]|eukprot:Sro472_g150020.1 n/a (660) ;mRNA; r:57723-59800